MIIIALPNTLKKIKRVSDKGVNWCYIGKNVNVKEKIADTFGKENMFYLKDRLHKIAEELRQPFLDFVANIGRLQENKLNWWASRFASKSPFQTDFFLLLCYEKLIEEVVKEIYDKTESICIIVEDPWLFTQLKGLDFKSQKIMFVGYSCLLRKKFLWLTRGIIYRFMLLLYLIVQKCITYFFYRRNVPYAVRRGKRAVALLSYIDESTFNNKDNKYKDKYLSGEMEDFLLSKDIAVIRPTYLQFSLKFIPKCRINADTIWPLILNLKLRDIIVPILMWWQPKIPPDFKMFINDTPLKVLFERERWQEFGLMVFNLNLMFYYSMLNFFSKGWCKVLVYTFENQPFEKMICMAKNSYPDIKLIGYRNSHSPWFYLSLFLGEGEHKFVPLPDRIITMGNHAYKMFLEKGGYIDGILRNGGAWRYTYLWERDFQIAKDNASKTVLVATPIDPLIAKTLLLDLKRAFYNTHTDIKFLIKCHPSTPFSLLKIEMHNNDLFQIVDYPIEQLFDTVGTVIYTTSTVGIEALVKGKKVIRFIPNNLITADPLDGIASNLYFTCYEGDCFEIILKALQSNITEKTKTAIMQLKNEYFDKVNYDLWLREVTTNN